jgi:hypothetical protein
MDMGTGAKQPPQQQAPMIAEPVFAQTVLQNGFPSFTLTIEPRKPLSCLSISS